MNPLFGALVDELGHFPVPANLTAAYTSIARWLNFIALPHRKQLQEIDQETERTFTLRLRQASQRPLRIIVGTVY
jgi:hypothetical protein